jgi:hypothetical protein
MQYCHDVLERLLIPLILEIREKDILPKAFCELIKQRESPMEAFKDIFQWTLKFRNKFINFY